MQITKEEIYRRWQSGETDRLIAEELGWHTEKLRGQRKRWRDSNRDKVRAIEEELGPRPVVQARAKPRPGPSHSFDENGNQAVLTCVSRVRSEEELLDAFGVDRTVWRTDRMLINNWEVGAKTVERNLDIVDGKITGTIKSEAGLTVEPLFQIKVWLTRIRPEAFEWPSLQPVQVVSKKPLGTVRPVRGFRRALIFGDSQMGFIRHWDTDSLEPLHDRRALDIIVQAVEAFQPDEIHDNGDGSDLAEWTERYVVSPEFHFTTQAMIYERPWWYSKMQQVAPGAEIYVHMGNHDIRMDNMMARNMVAACKLKAADMRDDYPVMSLPFLMGLRRMGINWLGSYPDDIRWLNSRIKVYHGKIARSGSGDTAKAILRDTNHVHVVNHIHRSEIAMASRLVHDQEGSHQVAKVMSPGCVCRIDGVVPGVKKRQNWQQGFLVIDYQPDGDGFYTIFVDINNGTAMFEGAMHEARDVLEQLSDETQYAF